MRKVSIVKFVIIFLLAPFASAQSGGQAQAEAETWANALVSLTQLSSFVDANLKFCQSAAPDTAPAVTRAADAWYSSSGLTALTTIKSTMPGVGENLKASADELEAVVLADLQARAGGLELSYNFYLDPENSDGFYLLGDPYTLGRKLQ